MKTNNINKQHILDDNVRGHLYFDFTRKVYKPLICCYNFKTLRNKLNIQRKNDNDL